MRITGGRSSSKGETAVSADIAMRLARVFGTTAEYWMNLQRACEASIDLALHLSLTEPAFFVGFQGTLDATGRAVGAIDLPDIPVLYGVDLYVAFLTFPVGDPWGISEATKVRFED